jgi:glycosyltransferase involved in cell wall biosynthesis
MNLEVNQTATAKLVGDIGEVTKSTNQTLSVCMMMQNSEKTLAIALESLRDVYDELIIVDGGSKDLSCKIAASYGARIIHSPWKGNHSEQRNVYLQEVKTDWIFVIDSDEFIDQKTLEFLKELKNSGRAATTDNFWIARKWISPFNKSYFVSSSPHYPDWQRRIFRYNKSIKYSGLIHESIHGLEKSGEALPDVCVYHSDLLIKSESQRQEKVQRYMKNNPEDGMPHYYLPNLEQLALQKWDHQSLLPEVQHLINSMPMKCKICESDSHNFAQGRLLGKYDVDYYQCSNCGFVQTEEPYWLEEAYSQAIASSDVGYAYRNLMFSQISKSLLFNFFNHEARFLDYGGGYGLFVRLMRDAGFDFHWLDKFCQNIFAQGFEIDQAKKNEFELVTAFEVFEHLVHPANELEELLKISRNILLSTELLPENNPKPDEWWYYVLHEGQHISLYTIKSLQVLAAKFGLNLYSNGASLHLLTEKEMPEDLFEKLATGKLGVGNKASLLQNDFEKAVKKIIHFQQQEKTTTTPEIDDLPRKPTIIVDAVFFQFYQTGIGRVWISLLNQWLKTGLANHIVVLDRQGTAPKIPGIRYRSLPLYNDANPEQERALLQQICDEEQADIFISSYYTVPETTPSVFMAYDMIPEAMGHINLVMMREKHYAINHAQAVISISVNTVQDLKKFFPEAYTKPTTVAHCGVSEEFATTSPADVRSFKQKYGIRRPYFLLVGSAFSQPNNYKNGDLFFQAFAKLENHDSFDIVCTGGNSLNPHFRQYTSGSTVHMLRLPDEELRLAYAGAIALVFPSRYEGFGMPIIEAMACGCPVITCANSSIPEVAGEAALYVSESDLTQMAEALNKVQRINVREHLIQAGLCQAQKFTWVSMAEKVANALVEATFDHLNLREINYIVCPDWSQPEELVSAELEDALSKVANSSEKDKTTLLIALDGSDADETADLIVSSAAMNLLMTSDIDITDGLEISLVDQLSDLQWQVLLPRLTSQLKLEHENQSLISTKLPKVPIL